MHGSSVPVGATPGWANPIYFCWACAAPVKQKTVSSAENSAIDPNTLFIMIFSPELELLALVVEQPFAISANAAAVLRKEFYPHFFEKGLAN
jgi:hypothetical protein